MNRLISIATFSLLASVLGDSPAPPLCKHRHASCQRYQQECSVVSCCNPLQTAGYQAAPVSGKYLLKTGSYSTSAAFCDMETDGGGWTVIMRRSFEGLSFERLYHKYEDGFGELDGEFWYGLRLMRDITSHTHYEMRFDMFDDINDTESTEHAFYGNFKVEGENYTLVLRNFSSSGDKLMDNLIQFSNRPFLAKREKQHWVDSCTRDFKGGWWYAEYCTAGMGQTPGIIPTAIFGLVEWYDTRLESPTPARTFAKYEMKIRPSKCRIMESTIITKQ